MGVAVIGAEMILGEVLINQTNFSMKLAVFSGMCSIASLGNLIVSID